MRVVCPECQTRLKVADEHAGEEVRCAACGGTFYVDPADASPEPIDDVLRQLAEQEASADAANEENADSLDLLSRHPLMVTTPFVEVPGLKIARTMPIIGATHVEGMHLFKDLAVGMRDIFGGRSQAMESSYKGLYAGVLEDLQKQAISRRAHAVMSISLDFGEMPGKMIYLAAHGTPVVLVRA